MTLQEQLNQAQAQLAAQNDPRRHVYGLANRVSVALALPEVQVNGMEEFDARVRARQIWRERRRADTIRELDEMYVELGR